MASVLGIDIGGTKTKALLVSADGSVLREIDAPSASLQAAGGEPAAIAALDLLASQVADQLGNISVVVAGSAGLDTPALEARLHELLQARFPQARVSAIHDTRLLLAAGELTSGCVLIFGTGSAAWALADDGRSARAGGWGWLLGDEGSGYGIVREAIRRALADLDNERPPSTLTNSLLREIGSSEPVDLIGAIYDRPGAAEWARHARLVFEAAGQGCESAQSVLDFAFDAAAGEVILACKRVGVSGPVVLAGGVVSNFPAAVEGVRARCEAFGINDIELLQREPVWGAVDLARTELKGATHA